MTSCIDCSRALAAPIIQQTRTYDGRIREWPICFACAQAFAERKERELAEWKAKEQELRGALARTPFGQVTPAGMRKAVRR